MASPTLKPFALQPHDRQGTWESNDGRYRSYAHELLAQLESLCSDVLKRWPVDAGASITKETEYPELWQLARLRDRTSDTVRIYAAMAVEGFLNFYGVLRLGQDVFDEHFERLGLIPKLRKLLLICDQIELSDRDPLCNYASMVALSRNALVHPKTREVVGSPTAHQRTAIKIPEVARECVANMEAFFTGFVAAVPNAAPHINRGTGASYLDAARSTRVNNTGVDRAGREDAGEA